jgi:hypothetical protein
VVTSGNQTLKQEPCEYIALSSERKISIFLRRSPGQAGLRLSALNLATDSAQAGSSFLTKFTRLLTSYRRIRLGSNGLSRSQMASDFWKPGLIHSPGPSALPT